MSMHKIPLTELERRGLELHHLPIGTPSQLSDCFRIGMNWYKEQASKELEYELENMINLVAGLSMALGRDCNKLLDYKQALATLKRHRGF